MDLKQKPFDKLLVIASSARMLAQLVVDAGFVPVAIDCYGDADTRVLALDVVKVTSLAIADIHAVIGEMIKKHGLRYLIYGSGFENQPDSLEYLESRLIVLGNSLKLFRQFQAKADFFGNLRLLNIQYPETVFSPPCDDGEWLIKPMQGQGGYGISRFDGAQTIDAEHFYWQRYQAGKAYSVLFVACHQQIRILGFNRMWNCRNKEQAFVFAGIGNHAVISEQNQVLLAQWLQDLLQIYPLQGLAGLDFIVNDGVCYLLEINARIPASAQLYGKSVLNVHLQACLGKLPNWDFSHAPAGYQILFAKQSVQISSGLVWPDWVVDRPEAGVFIGKGQPVCSIIASENDADEVENQLQRQEIIIENLLKYGALPSCNTRQASINTRNL